MTDKAAEIEALELRLMRAWVAGDAKEMKRLTARDFMCMVGTQPPQLLDRPSVLAALGRGFACTRFQLREVIVRNHGKCAWFVTGAELELMLGAKAWSGGFLISDLWRRGALGGWKLTGRSIARLEPEARFADAVRALQLWT